MPSRPLTDSEKSLLAPYIPAVDLENAIVHEGKVPWYLPKGFSAITRGRNIYLRCGVYECGTAAGIALLGHEMVHVGQYREGMTAIKYLWSSRNGYSPETRYENAAYALERRIFRDLIKPKA
jgi:hypothetical protein